MANQIYFKTKRFRWFIGLKILCIGLLMSVICFPSLVFAGNPIGGSAGIQIYNVGVGRFSVVWQVDVESTCSVKVFDDITGTTPTENYTVVSGETASQQLGLTRGVMQVDVKNLPPAVKTYYIQTSSTDDPQVPDKYLFPEPGKNLIPVTTEPAFAATPPFNNLLYLILYDENGIEEDPNVNMIKDGVVTIVYAETTDKTKAANYPIAAFDSATNQNHGFPQISSLNRVEIYLGNFRSGPSADNNYWTWSQDKDYSLTIKSFGGSVPGVGKGQSTIKTIYPGSWTPFTAIVGCLNNADGCVELDGINYSQLILRPNQPPDIVMDPRDEDDPFNPGIPAYNVNIAGPALSIQLCAYDPEGDPNINFSLIGQLSGMQIEDTADPNCKRITWSPATGGFYRDAQIRVSDGTSDSVVTFTVIAHPGPPLTPVIISPVSPSSVVTTETLTCSVDAASIIDPDGDTVYLDYKWYDVNSATPTNTVFQELDTTGKFQSQLLPSYTEKGGEYYCEVTAHDKDGSSDPAESAHITVVNSPAVAPDNVVITPGNAAEPKTTETLTCTASYNAGTTADPDNDTVYFKFVWTATGKEYTSTGGFSDGFLNANSHQLPSSETGKGDAWKCTVIAWDGDGTAPDATVNNSKESSETVIIMNTPPEIPASAAITPPAPDTTQNLVCTVTASAPVDADPEDVAAGIQYEFTWSCSNCDDTPVTNMGSAGVTEDTLNNTTTDRDEQWSCEARAYDGSAYSPASVTASQVEIQNSPPVGLSVEVIPDPNAYVNEDLLCKATGVTDPDGDDISYKYVWKELDGATVTDPNFSFSTEDTLEEVNTSQGETWYCEVTAKDTSDAQISATSNQVFIYNRPPVIDPVPDAEPQVWDEGRHYEIQINASDPDGNDFTLQIDTNYIDPNVDWIQFDANATPPTLIADPPAGSSSLDVDYGPGIFKFNFIVEETDGTPNRRVERLLTARVRIPEKVVDDFEYEKLAEHGWYKLQGSGNMLLKLEDPNDPNSNRYLKTTVTKTPTNNSQLDYFIYKTIVDPNNEINSTYPVIKFSISDTNLYYFIAYVRAINNDGVESNYFLQYIPQDPATEGWTRKVVGKYVRYNIGSESVDPNGSGEIKEVSRDMEQDLNSATGFHYLYLKSILLRGDINYLDDIKVSSGTPPPELRDVSNLTAQGSENQVTLQWVLPPQQSDRIAGYNIYMKVDEPPASDASYWIASVAPDATSYTETGLENNVTYCFRVTAFDNLLPPNESKGVTTAPDCATTIVTPPLDPIKLEAASVNGTIQLTWENDPDQHPDLDGYMVYYCKCKAVDCTGCYGEMVAANKADSTGKFVHYITKDASQGPLQYNEWYDFTVKAKDKAGNFSDGKEVSHLHTPPAKKLLDNFDTGWKPEESLMKHGWSRLQGKGASLRKPGGIDGTNYLEVKSGYTGASVLDYIMVKWLTDPTDYTNPNLSMDVRSLGDFRIDFYLKGKDGKNYFLSYKGNKNTDQDSASATIEQSRWLIYTIGWQSKASSTEWYTIERNLDDDLMAAKNVGFDMVLGVLLRGTLDIDNLELGEGVLDVKYLTARAGDTVVLLSYSVEDPNKIEETWVFVDTNLVADSNNIVRILPDENDYQYEVTGLTNDTEYEFKVVQVNAEGEESKGVSVKATPMAYKISTFTFDDASALDSWNLEMETGVTLEVVYASDTQSNVMYLNPDAGYPYPDRFYVSTQTNVSGVTGMTCRIKTSTNFVIWVDFVGTDGYPFMLGFVSGGTAGGHSRFGNFAYYYLGPGLTDDNWHELDLNLDEIMDSIITGVGTDKVNAIYFGGRIYVDDVSLY